MSLYTSLYSGTTGLQTSGLELSVVGDNIANANTIGFKAARAAFEDAMSQNLIGGGGQIGLGTRLQTIQKLITQGALTNTGLATDLAIQGPGMFVVKGSNDGVDGTFFTRAGQFTLDNDGFLVTLDGLRVQGYAANALGVVSPTVSDLDVGGLTSPAVATTNITIKANLQADAVIPAAFNIANAANTSNFTGSTTVYDSLGKAYQVDVYYRRTGAGTWEWHAATDGAGVTGGTAGTPSEIASGTLAFDTSGRLTTVTQTSAFNPIGAVAPQPLTFNFGDPTGTGGTGLAGVSQFASPSALTFVNQDGLASGSLSHIQIDSDGNVNGVFSNGQSRVLGQTALASFNAYDRLERVGSNLFLANNQSGQPTIGKPSSGGRGAIVAGALEQSNVDLATEFVRMIAAQRNFQANSKTITTADQLLAELMTLKR